MKNKIIALLLCFMAAHLTNAQQRDYTLHLDQGDVELKENAKDFFAKNNINEQEDNGQYYYRYLQFFETPNAATRAAVEATGVQLLEYLPSQTYIASFPKSLDVHRLSQFKIRSVSKILPIQKLSKNLVISNFDDWAIHGDNIDVVVQYHSNLSLTDIERALEKIPYAVVLQKTVLKNVLVLSIPQAELTTFAAFSFVSHIEPVPPPSEKEDVLAASLHRSNSINTEYASGYKYDGTGMKILIRDDGMIGPHIDFTGRLDQHLCPTPNTFGSHGDMTSGIICGSGNINPNNKGHAPGADLYIVDYKADFLDSTMRLHKDYGVMVTSTSYSDGCNKGYTNNAQTIDQQLFANPNLIHVFSAGNSNSTDCGYGAGNQWANITGGHKMGKNAIACANLGADAIIDTTSSRGPTTDGRIKPDIAANGRNQLSTDINNTYQIGGGTSAASPSVAGCLTQLYHAYKTLNNNTNAEGALLKAVILNTANDLGPKGPDYRFGWGIINSYRALKMLEDKRYESGKIDQGENKKHVLSIPAGTKQVRVMLYWADPSAAVNAKTALISDLDLLVKDPSGVVNLPYILSSAADAKLLSQPATRGADHLNNMEQVYFENPAAGDYEISVKGFNVPVGIQKYFLTYEIIGEDFRLMYPNGGEKWEPGVSVRLHWDVYNFTNENFKLEYSPDGGTTWNTIASPTSGRRMIDWLTPKTPTGQGLIRLTRGSTSVTNTIPFSIIDTPDGIKVDYVCPNEVGLKWDKVDSATAYVIYKLGAKYMEPVDTVTGITGNFAINNPLKTQWFTVSALGKNGIIGQRSLATSWAGGILNCEVASDISLSPNNNNTQEKAYFSCAPISENFSIPVYNNGKDTLTEFTLFYRNLTTKDSVYSQIVTDTILPKANRIITLSKPLKFTATLDYKVDIWVKGKKDPLSYNDTLHYTIKSRVNPIAKAYTYTENFQTGTIAATPKDFIVINADKQRTWEKKQVTDVANVTGGIAYSMNNFGYNETGTKDAFYLPSITIPDQTKNTFLAFDLSHVRYDNSRKDTLMVEALTDCGATVAGVVYLKAGADLSVAANAQTSTYTPTNGGLWRTELVNLTDYAGKEITLRFTNINRKGNNIYIDNIRFRNELVTKPKAAFSISDNETCPTVNITLSNQSTGGGLTYSWSFGSGGTLTSAFTAGNHTLNYTSSGTKTVTLIVKNDVGSDTITKTILIKPTKPTPTFTSVATGPKIDFTNTSKSAETYLWDFGDKTPTSTDMSPTHTYAASGSYVVRLTAYNECGNAFTTRTISIVINAANDISTAFGATLEPNPNDGLFTLSLKSNESTSYNVDLFDARGATLLTKTLQAATQQKEQFDLSTYPKGVYFMTIKNENGHQNTIKVVVK
jgi:PKD repeat protein